MVRDATLCQKAVVFSRVRHGKLRIIVGMPLNHDKEEERWVEPTQKINVAIIRQGLSAVYDRIVSLRGAGTASCIQRFGRRVSIGYGQWCSSWYMWAKLHVLYSKWRDEEIQVLKQQHHRVPSFTLKLYSSYEYHSSILESPWFLR